MSLDRPVWLDDKFLSTCIQNGVDDKSILVKTVDITSVVPPGNNFGGCLLRVKVEYQANNSENVHHVSVVVKKATEESSMKEAYGQFSMVEPSFYKLFMPKAYKISPNINFVPLTYYSTISDVIVLEDLNASGYLMADRCKLLDFEHCRLYVTAAATFHAVSVAVHKIDPNLVESLGVEKTFSNSLECAVLSKRYLLLGIRILADKMKIYNWCNNYYNTLSNFASSVWDLAVEAVKHSTTLNTLHQGDPWTTNMMFKYDSSGNVTEIKLLDFQALRYSSPVNDLVFFLWSSTKFDVRESKLEDIYHIYSSTLNDKLEEFGCPERLSYEQLLENVKILSPFVLIVVASYFPIMVSNTLLDPKALMSEDEGIIRNEFQRHYNKEYCENVLPRVLRQMEAAGIFDYIHKKIMHVHY